MCGSTKRRSTTDAARSSRTSAGRPRASAVTPFAEVNAASERCVDSGRGEVAVAAAVEDHIERIERALGLPKIVRDHANGVVVRQLPRTAVLVSDRRGREFHDGAHTGHLEDVGFVLDLNHLAGECRRHVMAALSIPGTTTSMP